MAWTGTDGIAPARIGLAGNGVAWHGPDWIGMAEPDRRGEYRHGLAGSGKAEKEATGLARRGVYGKGEERLNRQGLEGIGKDRIGMDRNG